MMAGKHLKGASYKGKEKEFERRKKRKKGADKKLKEKKREKFLKNRTGEG